MVAGQCAVHIGRASYPQVDATGLRRGSSCGKKGRPPEGAVGPELFAAGREIYQTLCVVCHQADGRGRQNVAPALVGSELTLAPPAIAVRIMLHGKRGPTNVMPALGPLMTDEQIAAALTYVRREWGQTASAIDPATVKGIRAQTAGR